MISVSDAWKSVQQRFLLPESHIEIDVGVTDDEAQSVATVSGTNEEPFSDIANITATTHDMVKYATNELNLWALDGTMSILPSSGDYGNAGYVSNIESTGSLTLKFPTVRTTAISGITITWSETYGEYPKVFTVIGKNGDTVLGEVTITNNNSSVSGVNIPLENYNSISIVVHEWGLPYRRVRIEKIVIGHLMTFTKKDLLSFTHEQDGDLLSGKLPKYSIEFSMDNSDGRWDPNNPTGMAQYLSERQKLTVRYGLDVDGTIEWIPGGVFYLSEWIAPPNGIEARFVARDMFEFMMNADMKGGYTGGNLAHIARWASMYLLPDGANVVTNGYINNTSFRELDVKESIMAAEIVQKCANASRCVLRCDRADTLYVEPLNNTATEYRIPLSLSYSYPEVTLSKPLRSVSVDYGGESSYELVVSNVGEVQTLSNDYIQNESSAVTVAEWVRDVLKTRKTVRGEFRADPRLDVYDIVTVEDRYGNALPVVITNIKYTFNGAFHGSFTGRIMEVS